MSDPKAPSIVVLPDWPAEIEAMSRHIRDHAGG